MNTDNNDGTTNSDGTTSFCERLGELDAKGKLNGGVQVGTGLIVGAVVGVIILAVMYIVAASHAPYWIVDVVGILIYGILATVLAKTDTDKELSWKIYSALAFSVCLILGTLFVLNCGR